MKRFFLTSLISLLLLSAQAFAVITELKSYKDLDLTSIDTQTLVIFDIDNTLIRQNHMIGTHQWGDYMKERAIRQGLSPADASAFQHRAFGELQPYLSVVPVEQEELAVLKYLKEHQISHFALTARGGNLTDVTLHQIKILNHDFSSSFPEQKDPSVLSDFLKQGVIFSGSTPKGELLKRILANSVHPITKIIFIDDRKYNLASVESSLEGSGIELRSLRYGGADSFVESFNPQIADLEYSLFKESGETIPDDVTQILVGNLLSISYYRFNIWLENDHYSTNFCRPSNENLEAPIYTCVVADGDDVWVTKNFGYQKDAHTGGYYFGNW